MIDCISLFIESFFAKIASPGASKRPGTSELLNGKPYCGSVYFPGIFVGYTGLENDHFGAHACLGKQLFWVATLIESKMSINLYKGYTTGFLLKKTGFKRMTEVKF